MDSECFSSWFFKMVEVLEERKQGTFAMVLWSLWKQRNEKLWNDKSVDAAQVVYQANEVLWDWVRARSINEQTVIRVDCPEEVVWQKPPNGFVKCNLDAAWRSRDKLVGYGACIRDENGTFVACRTDCKKINLSVKEGEAWGLMETIPWVRSLGFTKVIFEMDAKGVVDAISRR